MIKIEKLVLQKCMDYSSNLNFIDGQITKDGTLLLIESNLHELDFFQRPVTKNNWTIQMIKGNSVETVELENVPLIPTHVDLFSDGSLLILQGRCLKDGTYIEQNARRYNRNGQLIEAFTLGDGIEQVQIDETDTIWVSYFDEGVFGNYGWEQPMGSDGLIAYKINGQKLWGACNYAIVDCYALNVVSSKEVNFYYYDEFFLVQLNEMKETIRYRIKGDDTLEQFMFDETGLIGQVDWNTIMRFRIKNRTISPKEKIQLTGEKGKPIIGPVFMRGTFLYAYGKDGLYKKKF
ncbi:hypothetical protein ACM26V_04565 [Salipaludibacillus sp. HK11]|uniref:hypothetical protein n=1 Tax=Salipaludibacillus sp. HK11 TaxID=3394320 RepID=UPI0039FB9663